MSLLKGWGFRSWIALAALGLLTHSAARWVYQPSSTPGKIALVGLAVGIAILLVRLLSPRSEQAQATPPAPTPAPLAAAVQPALNAWQQLGADQQARAGAIKRMFDGRSGEVEFDTQWDFEYPHQHSTGMTETAYSSMSFRITRELATLDTRESELLRATYLLYNAGLMDEQTWRDLSFCLVYGDGKAALRSCEYREPVALPFSDGAGAIRYYADAHQATVAAAARKLLALVNSLAHKPDAPPLVEDLVRRLQDGSV